MPEPPVLDSSILTALLLKEDGWESADALLARAEEHDLVPLTLDFARMEATNAVWKHCALTKSFGLEMALRLVEALATFEFRYLAPDEVILKEAVRLATKHRLAVYDTAFIALAQREGSMLVTRDGKQEKAAKGLVKTIRV